MRSSVNLEVFWMATITGGWITALEAKRNKTEPAHGKNINVVVEDVGAEKEQLTVQYTFIATYGDAVGSVKISGLIHLKDDAKKAKEIAKDWKEKKKLPDDLAELVMNAAMHVGAVNGTLVSLPLGLDPPVMLMQVKVGKAAQPAGPGQTEKAA